MIRPSWRDQWARWQQEYAGYEKVFEAGSGDGAQLGQRAVLDVMHGLDIRFVFLGKATQLSEAHLERARMHASATLHDSRFNDPAAWLVFPVSRGEFLRCTALLTALTGNVPLDEDTCLASASDYAAYARLVDKKEWGAREQSDYQDAIELLVLAGCFEEAKALIRDARPMRGRNIPERFFSVRAFADAGDSSLRDNNGVAAQFAAIFDKLRNPEIHDLKAYAVTSMTRLVLGALWQKYFMSEDCSFTWADAIRNVCE